MTISNLFEMIQNLKQLFDIVRLVDTDKMEICTIHEDGTISREQYKCYAVWEKHERCENCISAKACYLNTRLEKFELINGQIFHVVSKCVIVDGVHYALEVVTKSNDETILEAYGKGQLVNAISKLNERVYEDSLTGLKNRRFYDEQKCLLEKADAMALIDVNDFKSVNDTYGHRCGDEVLRTVAQTILHSVRESDKVIRYGGDEIYIAFFNMKRTNFKLRLEEIYNNVNELTFPSNPNIKVSISIGGFFRDRIEKDTLSIIDKNMYEAKRTKTHIVIFDSSSTIDK